VNHDRLPALRFSRLRPAVSGAFLTLLTLVGGLLIGVLVGNAMFAALPAQLNDPLRIGLAALPALAGMVVGSALWGVSMGRLGQRDERRRLAWAGILGFVPITLLLGLLLQVIEPIAVARVGAQIPLHRLFTLLFVPTAFLIAGAGGLALGFGLRQRRSAWALALRSGGAAALAFLLVNLLMEALGWRVGAPRAAERFTMLTVLLISDLGAALAAGAVIGVTLVRHGRRGAHGAGRDDASSR
jgi:MFS family permease